MSGRGALRRADKAVLALPAALRCACVVRHPPPRGGALLLDCVMSQGIVAETASIGSVTKQTDRHSKKPQPSGFFALVCLIKFVLCARVHIFSPTAQTNTAQHLRVAGSQKCLWKDDSEEE